MKELYFECRKCGHNLFIVEKAGWVKKITAVDCPNCGEEAEGNWILGGYMGSIKVNPLTGEKVKYVKFV